MSGGGMESVRMTATHMVNGKGRQERCCTCSNFFQMPLNYPRYTKADYEVMPEWKLDCLLAEYGLPVTGDLGQKRSFAMGAFLWPDY